MIATARAARLALCLVGLSLAPILAAAQATATLPADSTPRRTGLAIPRQVAGFELRGRKDSPDRNVGTTLTYIGGDSLRIDVFLYPGPGFDAGCAETCAADVMTREVTGFSADFPEMIKRGYFATIDVASDSVLMPPPAAAWRLGRHVRLRVTQATRAVDQSDYVLYYLPRVRVKLRSTYRATPARVAALEAFAQAIVPALTDAAAP
jgi:hypothetical protein